MWTKVVCWYLVLHTYVFDLHSPSLRLHQVLIYPQD